MPKKRLALAAFRFLAAVLSLWPLAALAAPHEVFYEVNFRAISASGDLKGAAARLPAIRKLGVTVVWLMPVYPVGKVRAAGGMGSPYSVADYTSVNPELGALADLQRFVKSAHTLGLTVILDWVANHTSWDNPWLTQHKDWYRQDASGNVIIPPGTGWRDVAQLDHKNAAMRAEMTRSMEFWLDKADIDGFRCDAADFIPRDFWQPLIASLRAHSTRKLLLLAEGARAEHYESGFDTVYAWGFCTALKDVIGGGRPASRLREALAKEAGHPMMHYATNHDECVNASPVSAYGGADGAYAAFALAALYGGDPLVYDGEEIAWPAKIPIFTRTRLDWDTGQAEVLRFTALLSLVNDHESLRRGELREFGNDDVIAFTRKLGKEAFTVLVNVRKTPTSILLPDGNQSRIALGAYEVRITRSN
jgi:glycosidase